MNEMCVYLGDEGLLSKNSMPTEILISFYSAVSGQSVCKNI